MSKSVIIIGGGLGGLFTGAILAKEGLQVTVIEKNAIIGGGLQSFKRFGELFDTGMHIIGGMQKDGIATFIADDATFVKGENAVEIIASAAMTLHDFSVHVKFQ